MRESTDTSRRFLEGGIATLPAEEVAMGDACQERTVKPLGFHVPQAGNVTPWRNGAMGSIIVRMDLMRPGAQNAPNL